MKFQEILFAIKIFKSVIVSSKEIFRCKNLDQYGGKNAIWMEAKSIIIGYQTEYEIGCQALEIIKDQLESRTARR